MIDDNNNNGDDDDGEIDDDGDDDGGNDEFGKGEVVEIGVGAKGGEVEVGGEEEEEENIQVLRGEVE